jgi:hypothetical protein
MPLEIRELIVRAQVGSNEQSSTTPANNGSKAPPSNIGQLSHEAMQILEKWEEIRRNLKER